MGCLTVHISQPIIPNTCRVEVENGNSAVDCITQNKNGSLSLYVSSKNADIDADTAIKNVPISFRSDNKNIKINITAALVCQVSIGVYEYLYVTDGPLLVVNGYLIVKKPLK